MSSSDDRIIRFAGLKPGVYEYTWTMGGDLLTSFENDEIEGGKVDFQVKMERTAHMLLINFAFKGEVATRCDRCLGEMKIGVEGEEHLNVRFSDNEESEDEETVILPVDADEIDLTPWMYEYVAVRMPLQHMHAEGECDPEVTKYISEEGSQPTEDYIDPRWEALKELK